MRRLTGRLAAILAVAAAAWATLHRLGDTPPGLQIDEAAIGLTARSLGETGRDLGGNVLPLYPLSFPDLARPMPVNPIYTYLAIPFALAGPGPWSARLPSVLWLWAAAAGIGLLATEITSSRAAGVAFGATSALTPWLFAPGRIGWEVISFPALTAFALLFFARGLRTGRRGTFVLSGSLFGLSIYAYSTARLIVPLTLLAAAALLARDAGARRHVAIFLAPAALLAAPLAVHMAAHPGLLTWRFGQEAVWAGGAGAGEAARRALLNHASYLSPVYLFLRGDPDVQHGTGRGMLLWAWGPLAVAGIGEAWRRRREAAPVLFVAGLLVSPAGAALMARGQPHALRSITGAVFWAALAALGLRRLMEVLPRPRAAGAAAAALILAAGLEAGLFLQDYFGAYRDRALPRFDAGAGAALEAAFRVRAGRPLFVPEPLHGDVRQRVLPAYWGRLPLDRRPGGGADALGIHAWLGEAPPGSLIVVDRLGVPAPPGSRRIFPPRPDARLRYELYELRGR